VDAQLLRVIDVVFYYLVIIRKELHHEGSIPLYMYNLNNGVQGY